MWVLGVNAPSAGWHDASACLVDGRGRVIAFSEEERFSRRRHSLFRGPKLAVEFCLRSAGIEPADIEVVAVGWDSAWMHPGRGTAPRDTLWKAVGWAPADCEAELVNVPHHRAHAICAFHSSDYERAAVLVVDGNGEREATSIWSCELGREPRLEHSWPVSHSLGYAYDAASRWLGFSLLDAGKTMGLAAYGRARKVGVPPLITIDDGDYRLAVGDPKGESTDHPRELAQQYKRILRAWEARFAEVANADGPSAAGDLLHDDPVAVKVAYSAQLLIEQAMGWLSETARRIVGVRELCLAGGVALNCSANGLLEPPLYVPPVPHDAGVALGAAWSVAPPARAAGTLSPYLGEHPGRPSAGLLDGHGIRREAWDAERLAALLLAGKIGALVEGRAEIGPRALCHRSLIALPRPADVSRRLNALKHREPWRPFGPVALGSSATGLWETGGSLHDYMLAAAAVTELGASVAPAAIHVDQTTRPQRIRQTEAPQVAEVLRALEARGEPGVLVNTSFNDRGQPIVNSADEAAETFGEMGLDFLTIEDEVFVRDA